MSERLLEVFCAECGWKDVTVEWSLQQTMAQHRHQHRRVKTTVLLIVTPAPVPREVEGEAGR